MSLIASRKRAADILSNETDEEGDDHHAQSPPSKVRRTGRIGPPVAGSQDTGMVQSILDANLDSMDESDKEDQEYQEEEEAEAEAEEDMEEAEGEENMEEAEGEHDKFAGEEVSADCNLIQVPNRLL
jgi:histone acetyltransferase SAS3